MERDAGGRFAWEADTLPAELLPLGAGVVIADRARAAEGGLVKAFQAPGHSAQEAAIQPV
jgi:hypothetical protein